MRSNKTPWIVGGVLVFLLIVGVVCSGGKKKSKSAKSPPVSSRALVVPATRSRTVVVPPCNTPVSTTVRNATARRPSPGATTFQLPAGRGVYTVLVPNCQPTKTGSTTVDGGTPSAAFVLGDRKRLSKDKDGKLEADGVVAGSQLLLPEGSNTSIIVVPGCIKKPEEKARDVILRRSSAVAVAPAC